MKKVVISFHMPKENEYIGGIASILNSYLANGQSFNHRGYSIDLADFDDKLASWIPLSPVRTMIYGILQYRKINAMYNTDKIDILHIHTSRRFLFLKDVLLGSALAKKLMCKVVLSIHVGDINTVNKYLPKCIRKLSVYLLNNYFSKVIFLSSRMKDQFVEAGLDSTRTEILYTFHDLCPIQNPQSQSADGLRCLFMGMINRDKGILDLLNAFKECQDIPVTLDICGTVTDESIRESYVKLVTELGKSVMEHGYVSGELKRKLLDQADVFILPSYHEGLPLVVMEALGTGCALILTRVGAMPEILDDSNVIWIEPGDVSGLTKAIKQICADNEKLVKMQDINWELGKAYSLEAHITNLCKIYSSSNAADS